MQRANIDGEGTSEGFHRYDDVYANISDLIKTLDVMDEAVNSAIVDAMERGANVILNEQRRLCPPDGDSVRSKGTLKRTLQISPLYVTKRGRYTVRIGYDFVKNPEARHAVPVEFGRREGTSESGKHVGAAAPLPHIRPGFDNKKDEAAEITMNALLRQLDIFGK